MRLDFKIAESLEISREKAQEIIKNNGVLIDGKIAQKPSIKITDEEITIDETIKKQITNKPSKLKANKIPLQIIFEDEFLMVINKQAGISTHPPSIMGEGTVANAIVNIINEEGERPGIVHRLDKDTTGLLIIAKTEKAKTELSQMIASKLVERRYLALCYGGFRFQSFKMNKNIIRDLKDRTKMRVCKTGGKEAITNVFVKETFVQNAFSLVELKLETGRTHQIRLHLHDNGNSIIGDQMYGLKPPSFFEKFKPNPDLFNSLTNTKRQMLHAFRLNFIHPFTNEEINLQVEPPKDFANLQNLFRIM
jgi:23S rRNA pseudouridine1911/1915/1917 synthase